MPRVEACAKALKEARKDEYVTTLRDAMVKVCEDAKPEDSL
jgi:hypothetical protein